LSVIWLFRHGQAGTRDDYDRLSDLGAEQAGLLGRWIASEGLKFSAVYSGELVRQRQTATVAMEAARQAGREMPAFEIDAMWNEFDLDMVFRGLAPLLARDDPQFRDEYEQLMAVIRSGDRAIHRQWTRADTAIVRAWIAGRYEFQGESWEQFQNRVSSARLPLNGSAGDDHHIAVFTSATPIAIWVGRALELTPRHILRLAGASFNTAITMLNYSNGNLFLGQFNSVPHLSQARLRTFR